MIRCSMSFLFVIISFCAFAQGYMMPAQISQAATSVNKEGNMKGKITSENGGPIAGGNVTLLSYSENGGMWSGKSNKSGNFSVRVPYGHYIVEITAPGYAKRIIEIDLSEDKEPVDVVLVPREAGIGDMKGKGNDILCLGDYYVMTLGKNPVYKGKGLMYVLDDAPAVDLRSVPATIAGDEAFDIYVNGGIVRVSPSALEKYFNNIATESVKQIKVVRGNKEHKISSSIYITVKE